MNMFIKCILRMTFYNSSTLNILMEKYFILPLSVQFKSKYFALYYVKMEKIYPLDSLIRKMKNKFIWKLGSYRRNNFVRFVGKTRSSINWYSFICDVLCNLVPFVQFKKREKHSWSSVFLIKLQAVFLWKLVYRALVCAYICFSKFELPNLK